MVPGILGNRHPSIAPYEVFATADRPLALAVGNNNQFVALCRGIGADELAAEERFADNTGRVAHVDELAGRLGAIFATRPAAQWYELLTPLGVPCGPVNDIAGAFELADRLGLQPRADFEIGPERSAAVANPIGLSGSPVRYRTAPPALGADSADIRARLESDIATKEICDEHRR
ncbi:CoA transferase [Nocardia sp. NPDC050175]|uniref:CoA transferase n=1 Tax=Nocardia sp. NPDC050175 TaxID=3364317 RepID=UPI00378CA039